MDEKFGVFWLGWCFIEVWGGNGGCGIFIISSCLGFYKNENLDGTEVAKRGGKLFFRERFS